MSLIELELFDLWVSDKDIRIAHIFLEFGLNIPDSSRDRESSWYYSERTWEDITLLIYNIRLVDCSSILLYSLLLTFPIGFMIDA
jgi:hypothetical protein